MQKSMREWLREYFNILKIDTRGVREPKKQSIFQKCVRIPDEYGIDCMVRKSLMSFLLPFSGV